MTGSLKDSVRASLGAGHDSFQRRPRADEAFGNVKSAYIHAEIVLCVRNRAL